MKLTNQGNTAVLSSENPIETRTLFEIGGRSYSPRTSGLLPNDERAIYISRDEAEALAHSVQRDDTLNKGDKWAISKLIACWLSGEITDEASTCN